MEILPVIHQMILFLKKNPRAFDREYLLARWRFFYLLVALAVGQRQLTCLVLSWDKAK